MKINVLAICVQCEAVKPEILNTGQNGLLGGPGGVPGCLGGVFGGPRGDLEGKGDDSEGSRTGPQRVKKSSGKVFLRSQRVKYTYFPGFEHVNFMNFVWSLEAPGRS